MTVASVTTPADIITFWREAGTERWFKKDAAFDAEIAARFRTTYDAAAAGKLTPWESSDDGALALVIVLDQFPRNLFRGSPHAFATDEMARDIAGRAIARGADARIAADLRGFLYLPLEHSESLEDQVRCVALFEALGDPETLKYAHVHKEIIRRFGRFPHRNQVLGRATTPEEAAFLAEGGFAG